MPVDGWEGREGVPFCEGRVRDCEAAEGREIHVEVKAQGVIRELLWPERDVAEEQPGEDDVEGDDDQEPERRLFN